MNTTTVIYHTFTEPEILREELPVAELPRMDEELVIKDQVYRVRNVRRDKDNNQTFVTLVY